jgi:uncharacterized tellurite resistance protein B-like protein
MRLMFDALLRRLINSAPERLPDPEERLALTALLVRIARADDHYSAAEVARIDRVLAARFGLTPGETAELRGQAELLETEAPDTVRFTRALKQAVPEPDRAALIEAMWQVALADGGRAAEEDQLLRMVTNLLGLSDAASGLARQRAGRDPA